MLKNIFLNFLKKFITQLHKDVKSIEHFETNHHPEHKQKKSTTQTHCSLKITHFERLQFQTTHKRNLSYCTNLHVHVPNIKGAPSIRSVVTSEQNRPCANAEDTFHRSFENSLIRILVSGGFRF